MNLSAGTIFSKQINTSIFLSAALTFSCANNKFASHILYQYLSFMYQYLSFMYQYFKFIEISISLSLGIFMLFLIRTKHPCIFPPGGKSLLNFFERPDQEFFSTFPSIIPRFQITLARRPVICYTIRNIHFFFNGYFL